MRTRKTTGFLKSPESNACIGVAVVLMALISPLHADEPKPLTTDLVSAPSKFTIGQQRRVRE